LENLQQIWCEYRATNIGPGSIVIDLGASEGYFTGWAESQGATVDAYDARNGVAVGPYDGLCTVKGDGLGAYTIPGDGETIMVSLATILDAWETVDFLKCDIEGGEYLIFNTDLSKIQQFGIEFHVWTTPDKPKPGLGVRDEPMPRGAFHRLWKQLSRRHDLELNGDPAAGGYIYGTLR